MGRVTDGLGKNFRGKVGKLVFSEMPDGTTRVSAAPVHGDRTPGPLEATTRDLFKDAAAYWRQVQLNRELVAKYEARADPATALGTAYLVAGHDLRHPPVIEGFAAPVAPLAPGAELLVQATDDFEVVSVTVQLEAADGTLLETGEAQLSAESDWWEYRVQGTVAAGSWLVVTAKDHPGSATEARCLLP